MSDQILPVISTPVIHPKDWDSETRAAAMQNLVASPGWMLLKYLFQSGELRKWKRQLEDSTHKTLAEVENLQYKISVIKQLLVFPNAIIEEPAITELEQVAQKMGEKMDPYDTIDDIDDEEV